jgi:iron complex outermembrane receptor protein
MMAHQQGLMVSAALGSVLAAPAVAPAMAQSTPPPSGDSTLSEVIVTASRRSQSVYAIPSNITAITGADLAASGVTDISGISRLVPGLGLFDEGARDSGNRNNFSLRGLNANESFNEDDNPSKTQDTVSTYLGETPIFFPFKACRY